MKPTPVYVLKPPPGVVVPALDGAVFVEWQQICHRNDVTVFVDYKLSPVMRSQARPWRVTGRRSMTVFTRCSSLRSALKAAREYMGATP